jgi:hypothetical protein
VLDRTGCHGVWVNEYTIRYDNHPTFVVGIMEFRDGKVVRERIYFGDPWEPPEWRGAGVELLDPRGGCCGHSWRLVASTEGSNRSPPLQERAFVAGPVQAPGTGGERVTAPTVVPRRSQRKGADVAPGGARLRFGVPREAKTVAKIPKEVRDGAVG